MRYNTRLPRNEWGTGHTVYCKLMIYKVRFTSSAEFGDCKELTELIPNILIPPGGEGHNWLNKS